MTAAEVVGMGAMNIDQVYRVEHVLLDGEAPVEEFSLTPGGSAANTIYALAKLGIRTGFVGAVGDDGAGRTLLDDFRSVAVDVSQIRIQKGAETGSVLCLSDRQGRRSLYVLPGANNLLSMEDIRLSYVNQAKIVHLASFVGERQFELQKRLLADLDTSVKVSFAPGALYVSKGLGQLAPLLSRTHILFINHDELGQLTGDELVAGARKCREQGCQTAVVTLGGRSGQQEAAAVCYVLSDEGEYLVEPETGRGEPAVDTTGAGDAFAAGFLYGFLMGKDLPQCGLLGDIVARFSIARIGAREGLPSATQLSESYQAQYGQPL